MIVGIGTDVCDVRRMGASYERQGERFAQKLLTPCEMEVFQARLTSNHLRGIRYLASRFAAKEALGKAIGLGIRPPMGWQMCEVVDVGLGRPGFLCHGALLAWMQERAVQVHLSLADDGDMAQAFVVLEAETPALGAEGHID